MRARPALARPVGRPAADVPAGELHATAVRSVLAEDAVEQGGLAAAVGADDAEDLAVPDLERHVVDGLDAAERLVDVGDAHHRLAGHDETSGSASSVGGARRRCNHERTWLNVPATPLGATSIITMTKSPNQTR